MLVINLKKLEYLLEYLRNHTYCYDFKNQYCPFYITTVLITKFFSEGFNDETHIE